MKPAWMMAALIALLSGCGSGPKLLWEAELGPSGEAPPSVGAQAVALALDDGVVALNLENGSKLWSWKPEPKAYGIKGLRILSKEKLAVLLPGRVLILDMKDGSELWSASGGADFLGVPKGDLLPFTLDGNVQLINFTTLVSAGSADLGSGRLGAEAAFAGDLLVVGAKEDQGQGALVAYDTAGQTARWTNQSNSPFFGAPLALGDVVVAVQGADDTPTATGYDAATGSLRWRQVFNQNEASKPKFAPPAVLAGLYGVYAFRGSRAERLVALGADGTVRWVCKLDWFIPDGSMTAPVSYGPGVCIAAGDRLVAVDNTGAIAWKRAVKGSPLRGLGVNLRTLVTLSQSGHVQALRLPE